jgi:glycosyltransferase involved in cell wall biosynthesis
MVAKVKRKKVLFVAMQMSIHTVRWVEQISDFYEVHLFPINWMAPHPDLRRVIVHEPLFSGGLRGWFERLRSGSVRSPSETGPVIRPVLNLPVPRRLLPILSGLFRESLGTSDTSTSKLYGSKMLARVVKRVKPDLIHSLEFQHCSYLVLSARRYSAVKKKRWWATNWGSDIYHFKQFPEHRKKISELLREVDFYSCECHRDVDYAKELGLKGHVMPVIPNTGGFDIEKVKSLREQVKPSERSLILVKGYQSFAGRALTALDALERNAKSLAGFRVVVYSACSPVRERVNLLNTSGILNIECIGHISHDSMLRLYSYARVYIGISISDAISTSLLESMALGAFPIQTNTACCLEWIKDGETGFEVPVDDVEVIADRVLKAVKDGDLVDKAALLNWETVKSRLDKTALRERAIKMYEFALN